MDTEQPKFFVIHSLLPELSRFVFYVQATPSRIDEGKHFKEYDIVGYHDADTAAQYGKYKKLRMTALTNPPDGAVVSVGLAENETFAAGVGLGSSKLHHYTGANFNQPKG